ncbi:hypothetical protein H6G80_06705 [Nostoc sp. FACHB-87]|uniref:hypothetical protein n=1 Tax=Nostocaceae TaxID=1162 RepID=UPI001684B5DD|nr:MULTISPECIES: hypothetical protein [Nostocaceae]MBD2453765.1 hypothetical protein [Nostoc sp. FACHB-87]MBD2475279.1 hypothetical protein [Anabaena sp. FACHB-83]
MNANQNDIPDWILEGQRINATHLIVVYNASTGKDFPVYVMPGEKFQQKLQSCNTGSCTYVTYFSL